MMNLWNDLKIKRYLYGLILGYLTIVLLCGTLYIMDYINLYTLSKEWGMIILFMALGMSIGCTVYVGYLIMKYIDGHLTQSNSNIVKAMNNNFVVQESTSVDYQEGPLYSLAYQLNTLVNKLYTNQEQLSEERKKLNGLVTEVAHQMKTPVAAIKLFHTLLSGDTLPDGERDTMMDKLGNEIKRVAWLTDTLSDLSMLETGLIQLNICEQDTQCLLIDAINTVYPMAELKDIQISLLESDHVTIPCDERWTKEAIVNILDNAIKYSTAGSAVSIQVTHHIMFTKLSITDSGMGIHQEDLHHIFNRFYRGKQTQVHEGIGIGLYLAKEIMQNQNGTVKVYSEVGVGTTFELLFFPI